MDSLQHSSSAGSADRQPCLDIDARRTNWASGITKLSETVGYDEAGRLATIDADQVFYDPNGNRLSEPDLPTLTFQADNRIATDPGPNGHPASVAFAKAFGVG